MRLLFLLALALSTPAPAQPVRVGALLNPAVTQETIEATICVPGWTRQARPSPAYTRRIKLALLHEFDLPEGMISEFELDHRIPLSLGGAPDAAANLELQPWDEAGDKDRKEACLSRAVCAGALPLDEARTRIFADWRHVGAGCD